MVSYVDCGKAFLTADGSGLDRELMPDGLHPRGKGAEKLAGCLHDAIASILPP